MSKDKPELIYHYTSFDALFNIINGISFKIEKLVNMIVSFKHPAFEEEQEFRLIYLNDKKFSNRHIKFRTINNSLKPYYETKIKSNALKEILIGPVLEPIKLKRDLKIFCSQHNISPKIYSSKIPLRVAY